MTVSASVLGLPLPVAFGLPEKFGEWRPEQASAIDEVIDSTERFIALCLPTGAGKSLIPFAVSSMLGLRTVILTSTTQLQDQYLEDFRALESSSGFADLRGRGRYDCLALMPGGEFCESEDGVEDGATGVGIGPAQSQSPTQSPSAEAGPCRVGVECTLKDSGCRYYDAVRVARTSSVVVTSYAKWLTADINAEMGRFDLLVLDESHRAPDELASALAVELEYWEVESLLGLRWPTPKRQGGEDGGGNIRDWILWARSSLPKLKLKLELINARIRSASSSRSVKRELISEARNLKALDKKLTSLAAIKGQWVADDLVGVSGKGERRVRGARFDPVWPAPYAEDQLFRGIGKIILASATVRPKTLEVLGIALGESRFVEYPSSFPVARRPVTIVPTVRMSYKMTEREQEQLIAMVDEAIETRIDKRILIFSVSYARAKMIVASSRFKSIMITHGPGGLKRAIEEFRRREPPVVLVGPAMHTGVDFPMTDAEVGIVVKVPFPDLRSRVLKARILSDKEYGNYLAAQDLVQTPGRGMRSAKDRFETLILDAHASWFIFGNKRLFPKYFLDAVRKSPNGLPRPLPKL